MIYFATLKVGTVFNEIENSLSKRNLEDLKYYPKFNILKIKSDKTLALKDFPEFETLEEEKSDFTA